MGTNNKTLVSPNERFWPKVDKTEGCWIWTGAHDKMGYGFFRFNPEVGQIRAHRAVWILTHGNVPRDLDVLHKCDTPACVNPDHLFLGTHQVNMTDKAMKGRASRKLSIDQVTEIRSLYRFVPGGRFVKTPNAFSCKALAEKFGVSRSQVGRIVNRIDWYGV